jgi:hypothetical protein
VENFEEVLLITSKQKIKDWRLFWICIYITSGVILGFLLHPVHHLNPAWYLGDQSLQHKKHVLIIIIHAHPCGDNVFKDIPSHASGYIRYIMMIFHLSGHVVHAGLH